ncbi:1-deoxy-D-xylulose-5-phosphate reductoisomerase [Martelella limonii]|uniref:1-deoxy-D-xylulose-5-phosphate reductoisomerase n=1 Tax=Martelella limonii TaxID=1647649 RepID=UPI001580984C|nr:1-deoxy-D-xylulose-5-phosphate reductoisomerase [Martelella limonii]
MTRRIAVFGATGSIGINTLDVIGQLGGSSAFEITALTGHANVEKLARQAIDHRAAMAVTADESRYGDLKDALAGTGITAAAGASGLDEAASMQNDIVMAAIVGTAGLAPTLKAAAAGADIALANKECLVSAGPLFMDAVQRGGGTLIPVDSEHSAIFQVFEEHQRRALDRVIITASGGPFRTKTLEEMRHVDAATARAHPNWSMGLKISIDSASMFNKALEMIEAQHLFRLTPDQVEVVVHPQSIIHSMVGYADGSILAQLGAPDMRTAIGYALAYPERRPLAVERLDFAKLARLDFEAPDETRFPALKLARRAMERGGLQGAVLNGAKEVALEAFIEGRCGFLEMADITEAVMDALDDLKTATSIDDIYAADGEARRRAAELVNA